jgi:hypothetical protein
MAKARASGAKADELEQIRHEHHFEHQMAEDELARLTSAHYMRIARKLQIPIPPFQQESGAWMESSMRGGYYLTSVARHELRAAIRAERKARRDEWTIWVSLTVGIIGSFTGLVAVWKN